MNLKDLPSNGKIHMIGIGGSGMSGLAIIMNQMGYKVTGSDLGLGPNIDLLKDLGISVHLGHDASYVGNADMVAYSAAVPFDNPERSYAESNNITCVSRGELLGKLMAQKKGIAVSGTHGKTSTTSMLSMVMERASLDPTIYIGGNLDMIGGNAKLGQGDYFIAEACEAFNSFHSIHPYISIITNIEADHLEYHGSLKGIIGSFSKFVTQLDPGGFLVACADCENLRTVLPDMQKQHKLITYGFDEFADCKAFDCDIDSSSPEFNVSFKGEDIGRFKLSIPGMHNISNALAVIAVCVELGISVDIIKSALLEFHGAVRRFEILGSVNNITIIDDYAHHPTEVKATLLATRSLKKRIVALFQPHLFSRTMEFCSDFADSLKLADIVFLASIYPSREKPVDGITSELISEKFGCSDIPVIYLPERNKIIDNLIKYLKPGDVVIVMGAGDIRDVAEDLLEKLKELDS